MNAVGDRQRGRHAQLVEAVRARARGCATLVEIAALHEPSLVVDDGYVLCGQCRSTWPRQTIQTIPGALNGQPRNLPGDTRTEGGHGVDWT